MRDESTIFDRARTKAISLSLSPFVFFFLAVENQFLVTRKPQKRSRYHAYFGYIRLWENGFWYSIHDKKWISHSVCRMENSCHIEIFTIPIFDLANIKIINLHTSYILGFSKNEVLR